MKSSPLAAGCLALFACASAAPEKTPHEKVATAVCSQILACFGPGAPYKTEAECASHFVAWKNDAACTAEAANACVTAESLQSCAVPLAGWAIPDACAACAWEGGS